MRVKRHTTDWEKYLQYIVINKNLKLKRCVLRTTCYEPALYQERIFFFSDANCNFRTLLLKKIAYLPNALFYVTLLEIHAKCQENEC